MGRMMPGSASRNEGNRMIENAPSSDDPRVTEARGRTSMASFRTQLALDRTTLAWIRTTLTMASFGFGMVTFFRSREIESPGAESRLLHHQAVRFGTALICLGLVATVLAGASHWLTLRRLRRGELPMLREWPLSVTVALLFSVIGLAGLWSLFAGH
jgi:putative membrane protein